MTLRRLLSLVAVLFLALAFAGCSDDDDTGADAGEQTSTEGADAQDTGAGEDANDGGVDASAENGDAGEPAVDPCTLLTRAEVSDALGADVGEPTNVAGPAECGFPPLEGDTGIVVTVQVSAPSDGGDAFGAAKEQALEFSAAEEVDGLGDDAYFTPGFGSVDVLAGDVWFTVGREGEYEIGADDTTREIVVSLAEKAVDRVA